MNKDFEDHIKHFTPEFGNEKHIQAIDMLDKLRKKEKLLESLKITEAKTKATLKEIENYEKQIMFLLK